jgi:glycosyltransferase involved in cell wall biosynthesis
MILDKSFPPDPRVENEAHILMRAGHEIYLFCLDFGGRTSKDSHKGIQVRRYGSSSFEYRMSALAYTVPIYSLMLKGRIERFLKENEIEVMHVHDMVVAQAALWANRSLRLPTLLDLHENRPEIMSHYDHLQRFPGKNLISLKKWKKKEEELVQEFDYTVVVTDQARTELCERSDVPHSRVVVMPNTVHPEFFSEAVIDSHIVDKYKDNFTLLYLGDTGIRRGLLTAIEAVHLLKDQISNIKLVIVGANRTDSILKEEVVKLSVENYVSFEGWKNENLFPSYLSTADVCISPLHRNPHHDTTLANKLFQYMGFSKAILASDVLAQEDILNRSGSGLTHTAEDAQDFAEKCLQLYKNEDLRKELGNKGKRFLDDEFNLTRVGRPLVKCYSEIEKKVST